MKNISKRSSEELRADVYKLIDDMCGVATPSELEEFEAALYKNITEGNLADELSLEEFEAGLLVQADEDRLTPAEIKARDKVNAEIKRLGLDEEDEHDARAISRLFEKFIKEEEV